MSGVIAKKYTTRTTIILVKTMSSKNIICECGIESIRVYSTNKEKDGKFFCIKNPPKNSVYIGRLIASSSANSFSENAHKCARCHNCDEIGATYDVNGLKFCAWECFAEWDREEQKSLDEFAKEYEEFYIKPTHTRAGDIDE